MQTTPPSGKWEKLTEIEGYEDVFHVAVCRAVVSDPRNPGGFIVVANAIEIFERLQKKEPTHGPDILFAKELPMGILRSNLNDHEIEVITQARQSIKEAQEFAVQVTSEMLQIAERARGVSGLSAVKFEPRNHFAFVGSFPRGIRLPQIRTRLEELITEINV